jgi:pimeloyl-ACP methyl ester carboxylesterase
MNGRYRDLFVSAADGLRLYARDYGPDDGDALPVVCLPGLARTSADFHELAVALSQDESRPRRVLALDYRGRGRSEWDKNWRNYDIRIEANDTLQVLTVAGIEKAVFVGTSRGGLITMALGAIRPTVLAGAVLNDVGPILEGKGLVRIRGYVGKLPKPGTMREAGQILKQMSDAQFPLWTDEQWDRLARGTWREDGDRVVLNYDPNLMKPLEALDLEMPLPDLWPLFGGLSPYPVLAIRGANSDLFAASTLAAMEKSHPRLKAITVPDQGHAPAMEGELIGAIKDLIARAEADGRDLNGLASKATSSS